MDDPGQIGITFSSDGYHLLGTLFLARGRGAKPTAILLHGVPGIEKNYDLAHRLRQSGWNSLIFHYRGCWGSQGSYCLETIPLDVRAAVDFLDCGRFSEIDRSRLFLIGHSLGGWAAILEMANDWRVRGVVVIGAVTDTRTLSLNKSFVADEFIPWLQGTNPYTFLREWRSLPRDLIPVEQVDKISPRPLLIIHSKKDEIVPYSQSEALFERAGQPKTLRPSLDANHAFTWHREWLQDQIYSWLSRQV
jgi:uncharacterized protein